MSPFSGDSDHFWRKHPKNGTGVIILGEDYWGQITGHRRGLFRLAQPKLRLQASKRDMGLAGGSSSGSSSSREILMDAKYGANNTLICWGAPLGGSSVTCPRKGT